VKTFAIDAVTTPMRIRTGTWAGEEGLRMASKAAPAPISAIR